MSSDDGLCDCSACVQRRHVDRASGIALLAALVLCFTLWAMDKIAGWLHG